MIDLSLFESLFSLLGPLPAEYAAPGSLRRRDGSRSRNAGPRGCYRTADGPWIAVSGSTPKMAERFLRSYGLEHLLDDPRFASNGARVTHTRELDDEVARAIASAHAGGERRASSRRTTSPPFRCRPSPTSSRIRTGRRAA